MLPHQPQVPLEVGGRRPVVLPSLSIPAVMILCLPPLTLPPPMFHAEGSSEGIFGPYPPGPDLVMHTQVYAPVQGSPGLLQKGIGQLEVLDPTEFLPTGDEVFQPLRTSYERVLLGGSGDA